MARWNMGDCLRQEDYPSARYERIAVYSLFYASPNQRNTFTRIRKKYVPSGKAKEVLSKKGKRFKDEENFDDEDNETQNRSDGVFSEDVVDNTSMESCNRTLKYLEDQKKGAGLGGNMTSINEIQDKIDSINEYLKKSKNFSL
ncbi:MAG: hypothetical protein QY310_15985 [Candidatus Jettenia sp. CY-1]|nr:MAG: hypothetical protein QY310_15985 [Candidatus Jettenia sp. CY-1]